ncbi:MAG TPA: hypothetical protein VK178_05415 [Opitutaceae bacterium]|nr:hypothetical protein [Opitutaceae bacterium]
MPSAPPAGLGRFKKHIVLGAVFGGLLSSIPLLNCLNFFFCLLNMAGIALALSMYFKANPNDRATNGEAALFGTLAGAGAGLIAGVLGWLLGILLAGAMAGLMASLADKLPPQFAQQMAMQGTMNLVMIPVQIVLFAGFGALGGFLSLILFFKDKLRT